MVYVCLFVPRTFDVVLCSTMLHHLDWQQGIALLQSMAAVARYAVVVNDLVRSRLLLLCGTSDVIVHGMP